MLLRLSEISSLLKVFSIRAVLERQLIGPYIAQSRQTPKGGESPTTFQPLPPLFYQATTGLSFLLAFECCVTPYVLPNAHEDFPAPNTPRAHSELIPKTKS